MVPTFGGRRLLLHGGASYGFATTLQLVPEDKLVFFFFFKSSAAPRDLPPSPPRPSPVPRRFSRRRRPRYRARARRVLESCRSATLLCPFSRRRPRRSRGCRIRPRRRRRSLCFSRWPR